MKFYAWFENGMAETHHYTSLAEARRDVREYLATGITKDADGYVPCHGTALSPIEIEVLHLGQITRSTVLAILNGGGYVEARETIETWEAVACGMCDACETFGDYDCTQKRVRKVKGP